MAPLTGFRFRQVGTGPVEARAGTLLALLGAQVVVIADREQADAVLADPTAPGHAGRLVPTVALSDARSLPAHGTVDGGSAGDARLAGEPVVDTAGRPTAAVGWAASGAMGLTGRADGPSLVPAGDVAAGMHAAAAVVELLSALGGRRVALDGPALLGERAALTGATRRGATTVGGAGRLLRVVDGWIAVSLPRPDDLDLLPAWLGVGVDVADEGEPPWEVVTALVATRPAHDVVAAGQELGLAVAPVPCLGTDGVDEQLVARGQTRPPAPFVLDGAAPTLPAARAVDGATLGRLDASPRPLARRRVLDLSALWAGPLATSILAAAGADVTKVESRGRPDGAREGDPRFFTLLDDGKDHVVLDLDEAGAREELRRRCGAADLVVEASRPRALDQLGVERRAPWLSITAYGRTGPWAQWCGFGDDAAAAGGLVAWDDRGPVFVADAAADPATGLYAAAAALAALIGRPIDLDISLREVAAHLAAAHLAAATPAGIEPPDGRDPAPPRTRALPDRPGTT